MRKSLGPIARAGIVVTVIWLAWSIGWRGYDEVESWRYAGWNNWYMCSHGEAPEVFAGQDCSIHLKRDEEHERNIWFNAVGFGLQWTILGWIALGLFYGAVRWVLAGRKL